MFPKKLDGAKVLYYTGEGDFGVVTNTNETDAERICYLAICKYENDNGYYLFLCDENYNVVTDDLLDSITQCFEIASFKKDDIKWYDARRTEL